MSLGEGWDEGSFVKWAVGVNGTWVASFRGRPRLHSRSQIHPCQVTSDTDSEENPSTLYVPIHSSLPPPHTPTPLPTYDPTSQEQSQTLALPGPPASMPTPLSQPPGGRCPGAPGGAASAAEAPGGGGGAEVRDQRPEVRRQPQHRRH